jgi:hypothetical protein
MVVMWVAVAAGIVLVAAFWKQIVNWANQQLATWLGDLFGKDVQEAFLFALAAVDHTVVLAQRGLVLLRERLVSARVLFRQLRGGYEHEQVVQAEFRKADGEIVKMEAAEVVAWHELPDDVREKFIRRQTGSVELELKLKE